MVVVARVSPDQAVEIGRRYYGVDGTAERMAAEHDDAFRVTGTDGVARLLKISVDGDGATEAVTGREFASFQTAVLLHLAAVAPEVPVQRVITALDGRTEVILDGAARVPGPRRLVRMTSWLDGHMLSATVTSTGLRRDIGAALARLSRALRGFRHPGALRTHPWDLQNFRLLRPLLGELPESGMLPEVRSALAAGRSSAAVPDPGSQLGAALEDCLDRFDAIVAPQLATVPVQVIHSDFHGENLLTGAGRITGILDFGDALAGPVAMDVGVAACYQLGNAPDVLGPALDVVAGYHEVDPLSAEQLGLVAEFIAARLATRIIVSQWNAIREPDNTGYLLRRTAQAIENFTVLRSMPHDELVSRLRAACDLPQIRKVADA
jgi:hydroxylysine kinase